MDFRSIDQKLKTKGLMFFNYFFFHVICKISNFDMQTAKHLAQASCTELTLTLTLKVQMKVELEPPQPPLSNVASLCGCFEDIRLLVTVFTICNFQGGR